MSCDLGIQTVTRRIGGIRLGLAYPGPMAPPTTYRPCTHTGPEGPCPEYATTGSRCDEHQRKAWSTTTTSRHQRGYDSRWTRLRNSYIKRHPVCEVLGCGAEATQVDHIVPIEAGGARLDRANLQSLCDPHHTEKTTADRLLRARQG